MPCQHICPADVLGCSKMAPLIMQVSATVEAESNLEPWVVLDFLCATSTQPLCWFLVHQSCQQLLAWPGEVFGNRRGRLQNTPGKRETSSLFIDQEFSQSENKTSNLDISFWELSSPEGAKGDSQVRSSKRRTPRLHQSTARSCPIPPPRTISGAMYSTVPQ